MKTKKIKLIITAVIFSVVVTSQIFAADKNSTSWISPTTLASVVKLDVVLDEYYVEGLPENYYYREVSGKPDFAGGKLTRQSASFTHVGSGVLVTETGLIVSNAHVSEAYESAEIYPVSYNGVRATGPSGKPLSVVVVKRYPGTMFVGIADPKAIEAGDDRQHTKYIADILCSDKDYSPSKYDRSVLQISNYASLDKNNIPVIGKEIGNEKFPYAKLGNPFKYDYLEKNVRTVGFPGVGDPERAAVTEGEMMGYDDTRSIILHTSFISGGNSGGGLFYKDRLIGINTWDKTANPSRPVSMAQPISYWNKIFAEVKWIYTKVKLPEYSDDWVKDDPKYSAKKDYATVCFTLFETANSNKTVDNGYIVALNNNFSKSDFWKYKENCNLFDGLEDMYYYTLYKSDDELKKSYTFLTNDDLKMLRSLETFADIRKYMKPEQAAHFDLWLSGDFDGTITPIIRDGKTFVDVPKNSKTNIFYMPADEDDLILLGVLTTDGRAEQGPYYLYVK